MYLASAVGLQNGRCCMWGEGHGWPDLPLRASEPDVASSLEATGMSVLGLADVISGCSCCPEAEGS